MDLNRLTRDADDLIRKVVSRYNQLYVPTGTISQLELDLMLDDLRKLYDTFKNIGQINLAMQETQNKPEVRVNTAVPSDSQQVASHSHSDKQFPSPEPAKTPPQTEPEPVAEALPEYITEPEYKSEPEAEIVLQKEIKEEFIAEPEIEAEPVYKNPVQDKSEITYTEKTDLDIAGNNNPVISETAPSMLADKFNTGNKSLSETIALSQTQGNTGSRVLFQPIADLTTGIGLNDKFSFISDLFANNVTQFDEAIHRINKAVNLDEANWILQKYYSAEWETKQETLARLKDFVKRRFI
ncbi:MAG: hypothetical protein Q7U54_00935 [Bacteroidales bacterium]|nr:hypothetical protein [Bacteroidales bacterium]